MSAGQRDERDFRSILLWILCGGSLTGENLSTSRIYAHAAIRREETFFSVIVLEKHDSCTNSLTLCSPLSFLCYFCYYHYVYIFVLISTGIFIVIYLITMHLFWRLVYRIGFAQAYYIRCVVRTCKKKDRGIPAYSAPYAWFS